MCVRQSTAHNFFRPLAEMNKLVTSFWQQLAAQCRAKSCRDEHICCSLPSTPVSAWYQVGAMVAPRPNPLHFEATRKQHCPRGAHEKWPSVPCLEKHCNFHVSQTNAKTKGARFNVLLYCKLGVFGVFLSVNMGNGEEAMIIEDKFTWEKRPRSVLQRKEGKDWFTVRLLSCKITREGRGLHTVNGFLCWKNDTWQQLFRVSVT